MNNKTRLVTQTSLARRGSASGSQGEVAGGGGEKAEESTFPSHGQQPTVGAASGSRLHTPMGVQAGRLVSRSLRRTLDYSHFFTVRIADDNSGHS